MPKKTIKPGARVRSKSSNSKSKARKDSPRPNSIKASASQVSRPTRKRVLKNDHDDLFKERTVSARTFSQWKPMSKASQAVLIQTIDSAIVSVLSQTSSVSYSDVQDVLNSLKRRILDKSRNLKAPATKRPKFNTLEAACQKLERDTLEASKQEEQLSEMIEEMTRKVQEKEKILEELEKNAARSKTAERKQGQPQLHDLLIEKYEERLGVPPLPKMKAQYRIVTRSKSKPEPEVNKLLSSLERSKSLASVKDYVTKLSDFITLLPEVK